MKASNPRQSPLAARALKLVGIILILSSLLDYIVLSIPFRPLDQGWLLTWTTQLVDRGVIPMVGLAFLLAGYWIGNPNASSIDRKPAQDLRFWALILSSILGLLFLLLVPIHLRNISFASDQAIKQINQRATQVEGQLDTRLQQVQALLNDPQKLQQLDQALKSEQLSDQQRAQLQALKDQLEKFKQDPKALDAQLQEVQTRIRSEKLKAENQARQEAVKSVIRTGLSSLLLSAGYIAIGWMGLRSLTGRSKASRRPAKET